MPTIVLNTMTTNPAIPRIPVKGFVDSFNRVSPDVLGKTDDGKLWVVTSTVYSTWGVIDGAAQGVSFPGVASVVVDALTANGALKVKLKDRGTANGGLCFRVTDARNMLRLNFRSGGGNTTLRLEDMTDANITVLAYSAFDFVLNNTDTVEVVMNGNQVSVKVNGVQAIAPQTVTKLTSTRHGLFGQPGDTTIKYDSAEFIPA